MHRFVLLIAVALTGCSKNDATCGNGTVLKQGKCVSTEVVDRRTSKSEATSVLAEFRIKQGQFHLENGEYRSTGDESDFFPDIEADPSTITYPDAWRALRIETDKRSALRCGYSSPAGSPAQAAIGPIGQAFNFKPPADRNWFYIVARCPDVETFYFGSVHGHGVASKPFSEIDLL